MFTKLSQPIVWAIAFLIILSISGFLLSQKSEEPSEKPATFSTGQWVKYEIKRYAKESDETNPRDLSLADLKISIIDKETIENEEYFWVEFLINEGKCEQRVVKFMIDREGNPYPYKLILKYGGLQAVEIDLTRWEVRTRLSREMLFNEMTRGLWVIPFTRVIPEGRKLQKENIYIQIEGKEIALECLKVFIEQPRDPEGLRGGYIWYSDQIPLGGLAKFFLAEERYRTIFLLTGYGTSGGKSVITESPRKLDFKE